MEAYVQLKALVAECEENIAKALVGNKSAGTRVRKSMQDIKKQAQVVRAEIMELRDKK